MPPWEGAIFRKASEQKGAWSIRKIESPAGLEAGKRGRQRPRMSLQRKAGGCRERSEVRENLCMHVCR